MIVLTKDMEVGVAKIDAQHKDLVDRLNAITKMGAAAASREETQKTLDLLGKYVITHFTDEEGLQIKCGYPKYDWHKEQHKLFIEEFKKLKQEFDANGHSIKFTLDMTNKIVNWIVKHIKSADVEFGKYYNSKN